MSGAEWEPIPWEKVRADALRSGQITEQGVAEARAEREAFVAGYRLAELRGHTGMTQVQVAEAMGISQARVSAMERGDLATLTVATVRGYVDALGGHVRVVASLDDTDVTLQLPAEVPPQRDESPATPVQGEAQHEKR